MHIVEPAPAKINLYLHITGRREDGYHFLDSLVAFADVGDRIILESSDSFSFNATGPFAGNFSGLDTFSANLAVRAAQIFARHMETTLKIAITLEKNLPLASGVGGGSADAAAVMRALIRAYDVPQTEQKNFSDMLLSLGADVPGCFHGKPHRMRGVGEDIGTVPAFGPIPVVLVNPGKPCATADVYRSYGGDFSVPIEIPGSFTDRDDVIQFLMGTRNDLWDASISLVPEIEDALALLTRQPGCHLARMTGSGATVFGLFADDRMADLAARNISVKNPGWWVHAGTINP